VRDIVERHALWLHASLVIVSFPLQVSLDNPYIAVLAYFPFLILFSYVTLSNRRWVRELNFADLVFLAAFIYPVIEFGLLALLSLQIPDAVFLKYPIIFASAALMYVHVRFFATRRSLDYALTAIIVLTFIFSAHWVYESYLRVVDGHVSWYAHKMLGYILRYNGIPIDEANLSVVGAEYRSYGLLAKHSFTGAFVGLGFLIFAARMTLYSRLARMFIFWMGCVVLLIGGASLALVGFIFAYIVMLFFINHGVLKFFFLESAASVFLVASSVMIMFNSDCYGLGELIINRTKLLATQFRFFTNISQSAIDTGQGIISTSFPAIYKAESKNLYKYFIENPSVIFWGDGFRGIFESEFKRGGDVALSELLVTYGLFGSAFIFYAVIKRYTQMLKCLLRESCTQQEDSHFSLQAIPISCMLFFAATLIHYNIIFQKEMLLVLTIVLAISGRVCWAKKNKEVIPYPTLTHAFYNKRHD